MEETAQPTVLNQPFRTKLITVLGAPWGCSVCKAQGMIFDPAKLRDLQEKREATMECGNCKSVVALIIPMIQASTTNLPGLPGAFQGNLDARR